MASPWICAGAHCGLNKIYKGAIAAGRKFPWLRSFAPWKEGKNRNGAPLENIAGVHIHPLMTITGVERDGRNALALFGFEHGCKTSYAWMEKCSGGTVSTPIDC